MPRMRILTASEQEVFDQPPRFDHRERKQFFSLPKDLMETIATLRTPSSRIGFFLMCGYFKATKQFYLPQDFLERDIAFTAHQLNLGDEAFRPDEYAETTRLRHQKRILEFYGFMPFDEKSEAALLAEIATMARKHLKPRLMFDRCVDFLIQRRAQVPKAGVLLELIHSGLHARKADLVALMDVHLTDKARELLDDLFSAPDDQNHYRLTLLKKFSQSTKPTRIKACLSDFEKLAALYGPLESILSMLDLGVAGIHYYAGSVLKSEIFQIHRRESNDRYIHAAAFVAHQFFRMQDHLIDLWLSVMASFQTTAAREHKERL